MDKRLRAVVDAAREMVDTADRMGDDFDADTIALHVLRDRITDLDRDAQPGGEDYTALRTWLDKEEAERPFPWDVPPFGSVPVTPTPSYRGPFGDTYGEPSERPSDDDPDR